MRNFFQRFFWPILGLVFLFSVFCLLQISLSVAPPIGISKSDLPQFSLHEKIILFSHLSTFFLVYTLILAALLFIFDYLFKKIFKKTIEINHYVACFLTLGFLSILNLLVNKILIHNDHPEATKYLILSAAFILGFLILRKWL